MSKAGIYSDLGAALCYVFTVWLSFGQDTLYPATSDSGYFFVEDYDTSSNKWLIKEYQNHVLFSTEELASNKHHPAGNYEGYYPDGKRAFLIEYQFDGTFSEVHGKKEVYFTNGNPKEKGQYRHSIKVGNWHYFNENGELIRKTQYNVPEIDTVTNSNYQLNKEYVSTDTIAIDLYNFQSTFPILDIGKNGIEVIYSQNHPVEAIVYQYGKEIKRERNPKKLKQLLKTIE